MWLWVALAFAAIHKADFLQEVRPFNVNPSAISNLELLIPLALPASFASGLSDERQSSGEQRDHDESFSSIPAYAFTLDRKPNYQASDTNTRALPKHIKNRSIYIAKLWPKYNEKPAEQTERPAKAAQKVSLDACYALAKQQKGTAEELLLYICNELMEVLAARCGCFEEQWDAQRSSSSSDKLRSAILLGRLSGRRVGGDNAGQLMPRVFV